MAEWLIEEGIGEHRAILVDGSTIRAARIDWLEPVRPGMVCDARLSSKPAGARRGTAQLPNGGEVLVDGLQREATEGMTLRIRITRSRIAERGREKLALARPAPGESETNAPSLADELRAGEYPVRLCRPADGTFGRLGWDELVEDALSGMVAFAGGSIVICPTPAMTVIDIDGALAPAQLALAAIPAIAGALHRFDIGGSVGIDFPTLAEKKDRQAVDAALADALGDWRGERTAMNGFGFVQLISRLERPSIVARYQHAPRTLAGITLARRAEAITDPGKLLLCVNPGLRGLLPATFEHELRQRTGRDFEWNWDSDLALNAPYVQTIMP